MSSVIAGTKKFVVLIEGGVPPGMDEQTAKALALGGITITAQLLQVMRTLTVEIKDDVGQLQVVKQ